MNSWYWLQEMEVVESPKKTEDRYSKYQFHGQKSMFSYVFLIIGS